MAAAVWINSAELFHASKIHGPVGLPGFAAVAGVGLFPAGGGGGDARPAVAGADGLTVEGVVGVEVALAVRETACDGRIEGAVRGAVER